MPLTPQAHQWNLTTRRCEVCFGTIGAVWGACPGKPFDTTPAVPLPPPIATPEEPIAAPLFQAQPPQPLEQEPPVLSADNTPPVLSADEEAKTAAEVAQITGAVDLQFPTVGFIDPVEQLAVMRRLAAAMPPYEQATYPEKIRAKLLAHQANALLSPPVSDEELALAIYIKRTSDSGLTEEDIETKVTGRRATTPKEPKAPKAPKATKPTIADIFGKLLP